MTKTVSINFYERDGEGNIIGNPNAVGSTDDEGLTIVVPLGYLPGIENAPPEDVFIVVNQPATEVAVGSLTVTTDEENNIQVINVTPAE